MTLWNVWFFSRMCPDRPPKRNDLHRQTPSPSSSGDRALAASDARLAELQRQILSGTYNVSSAQLAEAMVRRFRSLGRRSLLSPSQDDPPEADSPC